MTLKKLKPLMEYCFIITFILLMYSNNFQFNGPDYKASHARCVTQALVCLDLVRRVEAAGSRDAQDAVTWGGREGERERERAALTEGHDGQDDGDGDGHPGHPQGLLAVALGLVGLQAHAAFQEA